LRILITGNMGYVGPCVVDRLRASHPDAFLAGLDAGFFANCVTTPRRRPEAAVDVQYNADVRNVPTEALSGVDAIVHLAAVSNDPMGETFRDATLDINHRATVALALQAKKAGVKAFVFASSCSIYGFSDGEARTETSPINPLTAYARSKVNAERDLASLASRTFTVTSLRFSTACGMSERLRLDLVLNDFVAGAVTARNITVLSDGMPWRPLINVKDMARAIDWAIGRRSESGGEFLALNVGSDGWNYRIKELAVAVADRIPGVGVEINRNAQPDKRTYRVDFRLFRELAPDHQPEAGLKETIDELRAGLEAFHFSDRDYRNSSFMRLKMLKTLHQSGFITENLEWKIQNVLK
jgi:nucleoside-diphosphate-sugar epimerase